MMESYFKALQEKYDISAELLQLMQECYQESQKSWGRINEITSYNQLKVLNAFQKNQAGDFHLNGSTGYGYGDVGRDLFEKSGRTFLRRSALWSEQAFCQGRMR